MVPAVGRSEPVIIFASVLLPLPTPLTVRAGVLLADTADLLLLLLMRGPGTHVAPATSAVMIVGRYLPITG